MFCTTMCLATAYNNATSVTYYMDNGLRIVSRLNLLYVDVYDERTDAFGSV